MHDGSAYLQALFDVSQRADLLERVQEALEWVPDEASISTAGLTLKVLPPFRDNSLREAQAVTAGSNSLDNWEKYPTGAATYCKAVAECVIVGILFQNPYATVEVYVRESKQRLGRIATIKGNG